MFLGLLLCSLALAQSSLPKCKGINTFLWTDCFGTEAFYGEKTYVGEYEMGTPNGYGTETWSNGDQYVGEFKDGKRHGQGTMIFPSGAKYVGQWKDNSFHGQGTFTYDDGTDDKGIWEVDELIERQQ